MLFYHVRESPDQVSKIEQTEQKEAAATSTQLEVVATDLQVPWGIAFLPDESMLVTERISDPENAFAAGRLVHIDTAGVKRTIPVPQDGVDERPGLRGIVLHPDFETNHFVYLYLTVSGEENLGSVMRYRLDDLTLGTPHEVLRNIPGGPFQDGGRMVFGADNMLYVTSGDGAHAERSQDTRSLAGKILRVHDDGSIPEDNPFGNAVYSYGHRNPQGIAWDEMGNLWISEHGPSGGFDEINKIEKGRNYGWPSSKGDITEEGTTAPVVHSGNDTWAPGSLAYIDGYFLWGGLRSEALHQAQKTSDDIQLVADHYRNTFGRIRTVTRGPNDYIYFTTSNRDDRAEVRPNDDKIYRIHTDGLLSATPQ